MCRNIREELESLNLEACGSLTDAQAQRLIHQTLFERVRKAARRSDLWDTYQAAVDAWDDHIKEHKAQAAARRAERIK